MNTIANLFLISTLTLLMPAAYLLGQDNVTDIHGQVIDETTRTGIAGAVVIVRGTALQAITDVNGHYRIVNLTHRNEANLGVHLAPGTYLLEVRAKEYYPRNVSEVKVAPGEDTLCDIGLKSGYKTNFVRVAPGRRYFQTEDGNALPLCGFHAQIVSRPWVFEWKPTRGPTYHTYQPGRAKSFVKFCSEQGINLIKIILEEAYILEYDNRMGLFQDPVGIYNPEVVDFWDRVFDYCDEYGVKIFICFYHTDQMVRNWKKHPLSENMGGPGPKDKPDASWFTSTEFRRCQYRDFRYVIDRWGQRDCIFALLPDGETNLHMGAQPKQIITWAQDVYPFIRNYSIRRWGKCHMQTMMGGDGPAQWQDGLFFNNPNFDFFALNLYSGRIANPVLPNKQGVDVFTPAKEINQRVRQALQTTKTLHPFLITETGPIAVGHPLDEDCIIDGKPSPAADEEYFHNMTWAHFASGGSGSPIRWGFRPDRPDNIFLTDSMISDLKSLALFQRELDLNTFRSVNIDNQILLELPNRDPANPQRTGENEILLMGAADSRQGVVWVLEERKPMPSDLPPPVRDASLLVQGRLEGIYQIEFWDTREGKAIGTCQASVGKDGLLRVSVPVFSRDIALTFKLTEVKVLNPLKASYDTDKVRTR